MVEVIIQDQSRFHQAVKLFNKKCQKAGIFAECDRRRYFIKQSERRRSKKVRARNKEYERQSRA